MCLSYKEIKRIIVEEREKDFLKRPTTETKGVGRWKEGGREKN